ncbi:MAG: hypothetical protein A2571_02655 [Candidatus Vogelbacteria bacterium RIFOXYD1_FULL_44_32]|uniref:UDP-N-acetylglucosamine--N-acetylmuramyl-(pentapeptide) pyrophosphoryl-undecaprenol N-acetylglucosamine transferase n=1 Tax=Candidatus Vogelbacteria bacterium RIFOXYD1_FULL_44_32 TaxID=1802438 RepID=A0A1G2QDI2_9BACT|nr:MAG: hypothetical protein A2571_02655 [Candidatus Vogelbacteria bacterium RIFOXYD1_FULL_44_32]
MKIALTGGGTGGHFYPIIAVAEELRDVIFDQKLIGTKYYFFSDHPYSPKLLADNELIFIKIPAGKWRRYFSLKNFTDLFVLAFGFIVALWKMFWIYPDVLFSKGGYASIPAVMAARILGIPIFIHESDSHPGRANLWASKFATRVALSYPDATTFFPPEKTAVVGNPLRREIMNPVPEGAKRFLKLEENLPILFVLGGSLGSQSINNALLETLPDLVQKYQIIHQTGRQNYDDVVARAGVILAGDAYQGHYQAFPYLESLAMRMAAGVADLVISRAGSAIFEIAHWGIPAIIIPIPETVSHDQRSNAFAYARTGGAVVIEENNLAPSILIAEIDRILNNPELKTKMRTATKSFAQPEAGHKIATEIVQMALQHES